MAYSTLKNSSAWSVSASLMVNKTFFLINGAEIFLTESCYEKNFFFQQASFV